jgi:16S rRNA (guanine966-N2)-methyltransferase
MRIVGGTMRGRALVAPQGKDLRPTSDRARESLFNILAHSPLVPVPLVGCHFLDGFCGTGAVGIEALSRQAGRVTLIDRDVAPANANLKALKLAGQPIAAITSDMQRVPKASAPADILFLDPPYGSGLALPALEALLEGGWIADHALIAVELERTEDFTPPSGFEVADTRRYGKAQIVFLHLLSAPGAYGMHTSSN